MTLATVVQERSLSIVMGNENDTIAELKSKGYKNVTVWDKVTPAGSIEHSHPFDTCLFMLEGEMEITVNGNAKILKSSEKIKIPKDAPHFSKVISQGCKYITAEKN